MGFLFWSRCAGSNRGPTRYECVALPTELHRRYSGAGEENRTPDSTLGRSRIATILHPQIQRNYKQLLELWQCLVCCGIISSMQEIIAKIEQLRQRIASVSDCL